MKKAYFTIAAVALALLTAFSAQAAEGVHAMGSGVTNMLSVRESLTDHVHLQAVSLEKRIESEAPIMNGGKRKDTTSAGIRKQSGDPQKSVPEREAVAERTAAAKKQESPIENKFGIYASIKEAVLDFFKPSRRQQPSKVDISRIQKDARTEQQKKRTQSEPLK